MRRADGTGAAPPLAEKISHSDRQGLALLVGENLRRLTEREVLQVIRHPHVSAGVLEMILGVPAFMTVREVRKALALHPATPRVEALHLLEDLPWRDLLDVGREARTPPPVRRAANNRILQLLRGIAVGERIALARLADRDLFENLFEDKDPRVLAALLGNPRLTMVDLLAWLTTGSADADRLSLLARDGRWVSRPPVREALLRHRGIPRAVALSLLSSATRAEWQRLGADPRLDPLLAACARRLAQQKGSG